MSQPSSIKSVKNNNVVEVPPGTLWRLVRYALVHKRLLVVSVVLLLISTGADVLGPVLVKIFIDDYLVPQNWQPVDITVLIVIYMLANLTAAFLSYWETVRLSDIAQRVVFTIRESIFAHILRLPIRRFDFTPVGSVVSRITNDTETIKELFVGVLGVYLQNIVKVLGIFIAMAFLNWKLMLICAIFVPAVVGLMILYRRLSTPVFSRVRSLLSDINGSLNETLQGVKVVQLFHQENRFADQFSRLNDQYFKTRTRTMQMDALLLRPMVDLLQLLTLAGLLYGFGITSLQSPVEIGVLYAFVNYLGRFIEPLIEMTQRLSLFQQAIVSASRVFRWLDEEPEDSKQQSASNIDTPSISIQDLSFSYDPKKPVLQGIDFNIQAGQFVGVVGHTGSGKSTLANLLMRFYQPDQGRVLINNEPLSQIPAATLREHFAIVQQDSFIFRGTIYDNVDIGRGFSEAAVQQALEDVGLGEFVRGLPKQLQYELTEKGGNLAFGQRQMISLARALAGNPKVLILDEATANVDSQTEINVQQALLKHRGQCTMIAIAHRLSTITKADQILVLHQGQVKQVGDHQTLMQVDGLYQHMYELQNLRS
ncbi:MAG: ATP-binding cassette domain-containing protein [Pseudomonadales bacterium]|nr:ATP-binding cassette domain-containing protein [Pseudomonadales bacterium]